ncbi:AfsR/SARP family transcriptional regulator [Phytomonospora endophytica]|uniref:DNA-binding SARP family transcriptional activator/tetratricopeptide (TPR) repeat protein n=1 Tax=Phytomonospora endophytica TaxID=714109 RepID=A0A841FSH3_9ACTN|nr:BTAD domain-containing putative transcriptional regulator [Phytomonospora endophytica]MBB6038754.1 DNA-binding SARP family transcriptional activator/tetratricopeptide (TPR) repeat protein [Phytomonospora endophytica]GIG68450.1 regulatory protein AfsR [Phytomonospora endophytica]
MRISLIGPVQIAAGGESTAIVAPKRACVLAVLAARPGTPVSKQDLIDHVWDGAPPESVMNVLYSHITRLRAALRHTSDARIDRAGAGGYVLDTASGHVDVHDLRRLAAEASTLDEGGNPGDALAVWRAAARLADGEALVGIGGRWAEGFRTGFRRERHNVLAERFRLELAAGQHAAVVDELAALVAGEPLAEALVAHLMLALYRCGRPAEALTVYENTRVGLRDLLGSDPSAQLRGLHRRILEQDPALSMRRAGTVGAPAAVVTRQVPAQLPADTPGFVGRDAERDEVRRQAAATGLVVIDGMAGVGKTALAVHVARALAPQYPDGQLYVDLRGYADGVPPMPPARALEWLLRSIGADVPDEPGERSAAWRTALAGRRVLLLLDNARDVEQVRSLLPGTSGCLALVTSRRRLVDLVDARPIALGSLPEAEAMRLFAAEAGTDADEETTRGIAAACGSLPLALRVAASRLRNRPAWTAADLLRRLTSGGDVVRGGVFAAFDLSYGELDGTTRRLFRLLSLFPGAEFDHHIAAALTGLTSRDAEAVLEELLDAHLVLDGTAAGGYRIHDLLREYGAQSIVDAAERDVALLALTEAYLAVAQASIRLVSPETRLLALITPEAAPIPLPGDLAEAEAWFAAQLGTIRQLIEDNLTAGNTAHAVDLCSIVLTYLNIYGGLLERRGLAEHGLKAARLLGSTAAEARLVNSLGMSLRDLGAYDEAIECFNRAARLRTEAGDPRGEFVFLYDGGLARNRQGDHGQGADMLLRAAAIARRQNDPRAESQILDHAVGTLARLGRVDEARTELARLDELVSATRDPRALLELKGKYDAIAYVSGDHATAIAGMREGLAYHREHGHTFGLASTLSFLTDALLAAGRHDEAVGTAMEQLDVLDQHQRPFQEATALRQIGAAQAGIGQHEEGVANLRSAVELADSIGAQWVRATAEHALGDAFAAAGDGESARVHWESAHAYFAVDDHPEAAVIAARLAAGP